MEISWAGVTITPKSSAVWAAGTPAAQTDLGWRQGQVVEATVVGQLAENTYTINVNGNEVIAQSPYGLSKGQTITMEVQGQHRDGQYLVKLLQLPAGEGAAVKSLIDHLGIEDNPVNRALVQGFVEHELPLRPDLLKQAERMIKMLGGNSPENVETVLYALKWGIPPKPQALEVIQAFILGLREAEQGSEGRLAELVQQLAVLIEGTPEENQVAGGKGTVPTQPEGAQTLSLSKQGMDIFQQVNDILQSMVLSPEEGVGKVAEQLRNLLESQLPRSAQGGGGIQAEIIIEGPESGSTALFAGQAKQGVLADGVVIQTTTQAEQPLPGNATQSVPPGVTPSVLPEGGQVPAAATGVPGEEQLPQSAVAAGGGQVLGAAAASEEGYVPAGAGTGTVATGEAGQVVVAKTAAGGGGQSPAAASPGGTVQSDEAAAGWSGQVSGAVVALEGEQGAGTAVASRGGQVPGAAAAGEEGYVPAGAGAIAADEAGQTPGALIGKEGQVIKTAVVAEGGQSAGTPLTGEDGQVSGTAVAAEGQVQGTFVAGSESKTIQGKNFKAFGSLLESFGYLIQEAQESARQAGFLPKGQRIFQEGALIERQMAGHQIFQSLQQEGSKQNYLYFNLPFIRNGESENWGQLRILKDAEGQKFIDPKRFSTSILLNTDYLGTLQVDLKVWNEDVVASGKVTEDWVAQALKKAWPQLQNSFEDMGYRLHQCDWKVGSIKENLQPCGNTSQKASLGSRFLDTMV